MTDNAVTPTEEVTQSPFEGNGEHSTSARVDNVADKTIWNKKEPESLMKQANDIAKKAANQETESEPDDSWVGEEATEEPVEEVPATYKIKVNGKEQEVSLDDLIKDAQQFRATNIRLEDVKAANAKLNEYSKQLDNIAGIFKGGDVDSIKEVFNRLRGDGSFEQLALKQVKDMFDEEMMPQDKRDALRFKKELEKAHKEKTKYEDMERERVNQIQTQHAANWLKEVIPAALSKAGMKENPAIVQRYAEVWKLALNAGKQPTPDQVAQYVKDEMEQNGLISIDEDPESLLKRLKPEQLKALQAKLNPKPKFVASKGMAKSKNQAEPEYFSEKEWKAMRGK